MIYWVANLLLSIATIADLYAVFKLINKINLTKSSGDISTSFCFYKLMKDILLIVGLSIYMNWVGVITVIPGFIGYSYLYYLVIKYKPEGWKPNRIETIIGGKHGRV